MNITIDKFAHFVLATLLVLAVFTAVVHADGTNQNVLPPSAQPNPEPYKEMSARWWQWAYAIPPDQNPILDPNGATCGVNQSGPVWFLAGGPTGTVRNSCVIPSDVSIFFPVINVINDYPCPLDPGFQPAKGQSLKDFLTHGANWYVGQVTDPKVEVDGYQLQNVHAYRATSPLFQFVGNLDVAVGLGDPCVTGFRQQAVSDGCWIWLAPLSPGPHTIHFSEKWNIPGWNPQDVTYNLMVVPSKH